MMQILNFKVDGMTCGGCAKSVTAAVAALGCECSVDLKSASAQVHVRNRHTTSAHIIEAIENAGFDCQLTTSHGD